jgi:hypothetical protein
VNGPFKRDTYTSGFDRLQNGDNLVFRSSHSEWWPILYIRNYLPLFHTVIRKPCDNHKHHRSIHKSSGLILIIAGYFFLQETKTLAILYSEGFHFYV